MYLLSLKSYSNAEVVSVFDVMVFFSSDVIPKGVARGKARVIEYGMNGLLNLKMTYMVNATFFRQERLEDALEFGCFRIYLARKLELSP